MLIGDYNEISISPTFVLALQCAAPNYAVNVPAKYDRLIPAEAVREMARYMEQHPRATRVIKTILCPMGLRGAPGRYTWKQPATDDVSSVAFDTLFSHLVWLGLKYLTVKMNMHAGGRTVNPKVVDWIAANYVHMTELTGTSPMPHSFWSEEKTKTTEAPVQEAEAANTARNQDTRKELHAGATPKQKCTHCGRNGHASRHCRLAKKAGKSDHAGKARGN
jgi:hypothetical protein